MSRSASLALNLVLTTLEANQQSLPEGDFRVVDLAQQAARSASQVAERLCRSRMSLLARRAATWIRS